MSFDEMNLDQEGYCLVPGHPVRHKLKLDCWAKMRNYITPGNNATYAQYVRDCQNKKKR